MVQAVMQDMLCWLLRFATRSQTGRCKPEKIMCMCYSSVCCVNFCPVQIKSVSYFNRSCVLINIPPWCDLRGWLGVKNQLSICWISWKCSSLMDFVVPLACLSFSFNTTYRTLKRKARLAPQILIAFCCDSQFHLYVLVQIFGFTLIWPSWLTAR